MKKFIEFFKNFRNIVKILQFLAESLSAVAEIYNKYFPQDDKPQETQKEVK